jgi:thiazole synthase
MNAVWRDDAADEDNAMLVTINGEKKKIPAGLTLVGLLQHLQLAPDRVAIERNREIAIRHKWADILIQEGDVLEIVHLVGGG